MFKLFEILSEYLGITEGEVVILVVCGFAIIGFLALFLRYLLRAIAVYNLAYKAGYDKPWIAFIPVAQDCCDIS